MQLKYQEQIYNLLVYRARKNIFFQTFFLDIYTKMGIKYWGVFIL